MFRKSIFWVHLIAGVIAGFFILSSAVTGMMLAFEPQITDWSEKNIRVVAVPDGAVRLDLDTLAAKAQASKKKGKVGGITVKSDPTASTVVGFGKEGGLYMNPYTGEVLGGSSKTHKAMHFIEDWHRWLVKKEVGKPITGASALLFLILTLSGILNWWPKSWTVSKLKSITVMNMNLKGKARDWNWHNAIGFWSSCFLFVISTSGVIMSYDWANRLLFRVTGNPLPPASKPAGDNQEAKNQEPKTEVQLASLDQFFNTAVEKMEGTAWASINIRLPQKPGGTVAAMIQEVEPGPGIGRRSQLTMASSGEVTKWEPFSEWNSGRRARTWARYLHTGEAGGMFGQTVAFLSALSAVFLVWTGLFLTWRRYKNWRWKNYLVL